METAALRQSLHWYGGTSGAKPAVCHWTSLVHSPGSPPDSCSVSCWAPGLAPMHREKTSFHPSPLSLPRSAGSRTEGAKGLRDDCEAFWGWGPLGGEPLPPRQPSCRLQDPARELTPLGSPWPSPPAPPASLGWVEGPPLGSELSVHRDPRANDLVGPQANLSSPGWRPLRTGKRAYSYLS